MSYGARATGPSGSSGSEAYGAALPALQPGLSGSTAAPDDEHGEAPESDTDELDLLGDPGDLLVVDDPLHSDLSAPVSFKRKPKKSSLPAPAARLLNALTGGPNRAEPSSPSRRPRDHATTLLHGLGPLADNESGRGIHNSSPPAGATTHKNGGGVGDAEHVDWQAEGPGRRVGYEDLTAIDWIFEYTKERTRQRVLAAGATGLAGHARILLDASQVWVVLVLTGVAVGALAAAIAVAADWLGDLKEGFCAAGPDGGAFYLNRGFCCYGYDDEAKCVGWHTWAKALHAGGALGWLVQYIFYLVLSISFALAAAELVKEYAIYARHSGIPEIKTVLGGFVIRRFLGAWTLVTKSLGLCLAVASGMWLGKEGPLVHVACCCANLFIKLFPNINDNEARKREVLSAAAASGISVAFGSPIGGVLFSLEQLSYYFPDKTMWQSFVCAMTAAVMLKAFDPFRSGQLVLYQVKYSTGWHGFELIPYAFLGILGGIYGGVFIKANMMVARWKKATPWLPGPVTQVLIVAFITALINYPNPYMAAQSTELVSSQFSECLKHKEDPFGLCKTGSESASTIFLLIAAALMGVVLAALTFGLQIPAGIILPSMAVGALTGRAVGIVVEVWQQQAPDFIAFRSCEPDVACVTPGTYAIVGAAAALAGVTRVTVSIVVIMFELTGALTYVLPIMVAVMISKWVGDAFSRRGIYESWIAFNEYPFVDSAASAGADDGFSRVPDVDAAAVMTRIEDLVVLTASGHTVASLNRVLAQHPHRGFPVVSDPRDAVLLGYISRAELAYNLDLATRERSLPPETEAFFGHQLSASASAAPDDDQRPTLDLRPWMDQTPITMPSRAALSLVVTYFQKLGLRYVLFCERGVLQGLLTKKDVWHVLNSAEEGGADTDDVIGGAGGSTMARDPNDREDVGLLGTGVDDSPTVDRGSIL